MMRKGIFIQVVFTLLLALGARAQADLPGFAKSNITAGELKHDITFLASDSLKGRPTPSPELDQAAEFIAVEFRKAGLKPLGTSYFHDLCYCTFDLGPGGFIAVVHGNTTTNFEPGADFIPYNLSGSQPAEGDIVFAGYGISAPEFGYDDYAGLDVQGKVVVVLRQEPGQTDSTGKFFSGALLTKHAWIETKQQNAKAHGAVALVMISGPLQFESAKAEGYPWPALNPGSTEKQPKDFCDKDKGQIPAVHAGERMIETLFGSPDSLLRIQQRMERSSRPASFGFRGKSMAINVSIVAKPYGGRNVVVWIEGSDPVLKNEAVVIGAHYDHVGWRGNEHLSDSIFNGADDNASGTSGMLAVARAFARAYDPPKRSVIFIAFAGEERGLLGSKCWVRSPGWPLKETVAMLNLDMIGRNNPDSLTLVGARQNPGLTAVVKKQNKNIGMKLTLTKSKYLDGGSDHAPFFHAGVPALFFFTGFHPDYHRVTDEIGLIDAEKAARVARLAFLTAMDIARSDKRYKMIVPKENEE